MKSACFCLLLCYLILPGEINLYAQARKPAVHALPPKIEYVKLVPEADRWVQSGEEISVEMKGTPGKKAWFLDDRPMTEVRPGLYRGKYLVRNDDLFHDEPVEAYFKDQGSDEFVSAKTASVVRYLPSDTSVVTTKARSYLSYGLGDDRLGGAKIGAIDSGIRLRVTGKTGDMYHVALAPDRDAWIGEEYIKMDGENSSPAPVLTGSWMVKQENGYDVLRIALPERVPYVSFTDTDPAGISIDLFGAAGNTNWITQRGPMAAIANTWYEQPAENVFRIRISLKNNQLWGYETGYEGNTFFIRVKQRPELALNRLTIMLDAGHGGSNTGARGKSGKLEKELTLHMARKLGETLTRAGAKVIYTRNRDADVNMDERFDLAHRARPDMLISLHCNASANPEIRGTSTYYKYVAYRPLSQFIHAENLKLGLADFGNVGSFNFQLNGETAFPNVLVETAFLTNPQDEALLNDEKFQGELAKSITKGIRNFLKASKKNQAFSH